MVHYESSSEEMGRTRNKEETIANLDEAVRAYP